MYEKMKQRISEYKHPNKEYQEKFKKINFDWLKEEEDIQIAFKKNNPNYKPCLDGGCTPELRKAYKRRNEKLEQLKKEYGIDE